ncbi:hypothetical protein ACQY0O_005886 [Thecaphora frezii]
MSTILFHSIEFEEIPVSDQHLHPASLRPSSVHELEDPRTLIYLIDDERSDAHDALAAALAERQRELQAQRYLQRLESVMEDELILDALGRRLLAVKGYDVPDVWQPARHPFHHHYHHLGPRFGDVGYPFQSQYYGSGFPTVASSAMQTRSLSGGHDLFYRSVPASGSADRGQGLERLYNLATPAWNPHQTSFNPFIHTAPIIVRSDRTPTSEHPSRAQSSGERVARIAIHPVTGLPVLYSEEPDFYGDDTESSTRGAPAKRPQQDDDDIEDEADIDWLGRELLMRDRGAPVWILDADPAGREEAVPRSPQPGGPSVQVIEAEDDDVDDAEGSTDRLFGSCDIHALASALAEASRASRQPSSAGPEASVATEAARAPSASPAAATLASADSSAASPSPAAAMAVAAAAAPAIPRARSRAATVMSESEEEELETVGRIEMDDEMDGTAGDRPKKAVKVTDTRAGLA